MRKSKKYLVLLKRPDKEFETVYFDITTQNKLDYFGVESLDEIVSSSMLLCDNAVIMNTYSDDTKNCSVFNTEFDGALMFIGTNPNGTYCDITSKDVDTIKHWTYIPAVKPKKKRVSWGKFLWEV